MQRTHAGPEILEHLLAFFHIAGHERQHQRDGGYDTRDRDEIARLREATEKASQVHTCLIEKSLKGRHLPKEGRDGQKDNQERVDHALGKDGAQSFGEGDAVCALQQAAAQHFARTGNDEARSITDKDGIFTTAASCPFADGG